MCLKEHRSANVLLHGENGGIEALEMPRLQDSLVLGSERDHLVGLGDGGGKRFLNQQVEPGTEQGRGDSMVMDGGDRNRCGMDAEVGRKHLVDGRKDRDGEAGLDVCGARRIWFDSGNKLDCLAGSFQFAIDTKVIAAECSGSHHGNAEIAFADYCYAPLPSTALRQRP